MICDKAFAIYMKRAAIPMKKHSPSQLRIRPARAGTPCLCATHPCQIPRMFSNGAPIANCRLPLSPRPWTSNQNPRKKDSGLRKPKSREKFAAPFTGLFPLHVGRLLARKLRPIVRVVNVGLVAVIRLVELGVLGVVIKIFVVLG